MNIVILAGALGLTLVSSAAFAQTPVVVTPPGGVASPLDRQFAGRAAASNTFEVRSSALALRRSRDPAVRALAREMVRGHGMAERELLAATSYADAMGDGAPVETPTTASALTSLAALDGAAFDKAYVDAQVDAHALTLLRMQDYTVQGSYAPLLRYDAAVLPEVRAHLAQFRALQAHSAAKMRAAG